MLVGATPGGKIGCALDLTILGGRFSVLYWGERVRFSILSGKCLTVGTLLCITSGGSSPGWAKKMFGPRLSGSIGAVEPAPA